MGVQVDAGGILGGITNADSWERGQRPPPQYAVDAEVQWLHPALRFARSPQPRMCFSVLAISRSPFDQECGKTPSWYIL